MAVSHFPQELFQWPRSYVEASQNVVQWTEHSRGGHFAAYEQPEALITDMLKFFGTLKL